MWILYFAIAVVMLMLASITIVGDRVNLHRADCIIVPGALVHADGMPGQMLFARIENAVRLFRDGWAGAIVFTGGRGESGPIESEAARDLAVRMGVPAEHLHVEVESHTTYENFTNARAVMREHGWRTCIVSTDPFHVFRCLLIARVLGLVTWSAPAFKSPGYTDLDVRVYYTLRECAGLVRLIWQLTHLQAPR